MAEIRIAGFLDSKKTKQLQRHVPPGRHGEFVVVDIKSGKLTTLTKFDAIEEFETMPDSQRERFWTKRFLGSV
jgi:hypothetical protein